MFRSVISCASDSTFTITVDAVNLFYTIRRQSLTYFFLTTMHSLLRKIVVQRN